MVYFQADNALRLLCVNGESFVHHPSKLRSFHHKIFLIKNFLKIFEFSKEVHQHDELLQFIVENMALNHSEAKDVIQCLVHNGFLKEVNDANNEMNQWKNNHWGESFQFHSHTNNLPKMMYNTKEGEGGDIEMMEAYVQQGLLPPNYKIITGSQIKFEKPSIEKGVTLSVLFCEIKRACLNKLLLGRLLYYAFGQIGIRNMRVTGQHVRKTVPSGGARHPIEIYLIIKDVYELDAGIYHYNVKEHALTLCAPISAQAADQIIRKDILLDNNRPGFDFSLAFLYSCIFARSMFRYRESRSYRVMHYDIGHLTQNLTFLAKSYGLNLYCGYSCHEKAIEELIGLDSYMESIMAYSVL